MAIRGDACNHSEIPIIDLAPFHTRNIEESAQTAKQVFEAFRNVGFAYIKNHGVPQDAVDEAFEWSRKFFALPQSEKEKAPHPPYGWHHRGYSGIGVEKASNLVLEKNTVAEQRKVPDFKESFEIGSDDNEQLPNIWPPENSIPGFRNFFMDFYDKCYAVELKLLNAIAIGMGLDKGYFLKYHSKKNNQIRLLHYPPLKETLLEQGKVECIGAHSDFGTMTMLFQDEVGGLEVEDIHQKGKFNSAPYIPGTVVVNIGDMLMRWSNDELKSTLHRVRTPLNANTERDTIQGMTRTRYSIPYFICADGDKMIDCVPSCFGPNRPKKYEPINVREYIDMRMNAIY